MSLSQIQSLRIAAVLEDCSHQMDLLGRSLTVQMEQGATPGQEKKRLKKIKSDCQFISQQMSQLSFELEDKQSFSSLLQAVEKEEKKEKKKINTQKDPEQKKQMELRQQKILEKRDELNKLSLVCKELRDKKEKKQIENLMEDIRLKETENSDKMDDEIFQDEIQQTRQTETERLQNKIEDQIKLLQTQLREERTAHEESMKFLQSRHEELQQQLDSWKQQLNKLLQDKRDQFNNVSRKKTVILDRLNEMKRKITEMEQVVLEDMKEDERRLQREAEVRAATRLQAWWRGCMVRRGLGAFKKAEDKKTKKKKGKKKK